MVRRKNSRGDNILTGLAKIEASGCESYWKNISQFTEARVGIISVGMLTHLASVLDISPRFR
ncbi:MAG: hypothetical protein ACOVSW_11905 [Candidatus Kapaibacteriota bacterium]